MFRNRKPWRGERAGGDGFRMWTWQQSGSNGRKKFSFHALKIINSKIHFSCEWTKIKKKIIIKYLGKPWIVEIVGVERVPCARGLGKGFPFKRWDFHRVARCFMSFSPSAIKHFFMKFSAEQQQQRQRGPWQQKQHGQTVKVERRGKKGFYGWSVAGLPVCHPVFVILLEWWPKK